jgi:hypothetical protein
MIFEICIIGQDAQTSKWAAVLQSIGRLTKYKTIQDAYSSKEVIRFNLTFITTSSFEEKSAAEVFKLRKGSHSRVVVLGSLVGFASNLLCESAAFDWCELGYKVADIKTRTNWYKERILSPVDLGSNEFIHENNIQLTRKEEIILNNLYVQKVMHVEELHNLVWKDVEITSHVLDVHLSNLRKKIKPFHKTIKRRRNGNVYLQNLLVND